MTAARRGADAGQVTVWDPVIRVFHWSLAAAVILALMSNENRNLHETVGLIALGLILVRVLWGFLGPRHARFSSFVQPPGVILAYLRDVVRFRARRYLGHNPAGGAMIILLLATVATAGASGWLSETDRFFGVITGSIPIAEFFSPVNILRLLGPGGLARLIVGTARRRAAAA